MRIHILGICGTFMGGVALIAKQLGHKVSGSDENIYPPMSTALAQAGIEILPGYNQSHLTPLPDCVIIGNAMSRGNPLVEYVLNKNIPFISGPAWLYQQVLSERHVLAISGTHGKTTTSSMLTWILTTAGLEPGYLIGGMPQNLSATAHLGGGRYFVIEADEYDTAFFDKQSKFMHYKPRTLVINNLEFDHADIFANLTVLKQQFQYLIRTVPGSGAIIYPEQDTNVTDVLKQGCWSVRQPIGKNGVWHANDFNQDYSQFEVWHRDQKVGVVKWSLIGEHNMNNALAAIAAAHEVGVTGADAIAALNKFSGVKRRLEIRGVVNGITVYDDFAHHPTAIASTLNGLRRRVGSARIIAVLQFGSYTMRSGVHRAVIADALRDADEIILFNADTDWDLSELIQSLGGRCRVYDNVSEIVHQLTPSLKADDHVIIMSNKGFGDIHNYLLSQLKRLTEPHSLAEIGDVMEE
ncbi:MAG: UDP-N-acetylmuramate:L-alanyl-gamma-D-glutamyl-meso-diaminopimelate ligase [Gammaproteobacteria bacterium]|nr:UDP-N-acetylmuramate:L-alanyl-gamma-D-glutamyl-meso-diaminopimelate ligase [Gammaproteobacteria bacterium]